jgi:uncharacterized protein (TIGR02246 family)
MQPDLAPDAIARALLQRLEDAWNAADGAAFAAPFTDDADFVDIRGDHHRSKVAIGHGHQAIFDTIYRGSRVRYAVTAARALAPDVILAHATAALEAPASPLPPNDGSMQSLVLVRVAGDWRIASFHNTLRIKR